MRFDELVTKAISIDSTVTIGTHNFSMFLLELAEDLGLSAQQIGGNTEGFDGPAVAIGLTKDFSMTGLVLQSHMDTFDPGTYSNWTDNDMNPFRATFKDGQVFGLGAADCKADLICKLIAASKFAGQKLNKEVFLLATFGLGRSYDGLRGALSLGAVKPSCALVSGATELGLANSSYGKSLLEIRIPLTAEEISARKDSEREDITTTQSRLFKGEPGGGFSNNSIVKLVRYIGQLPQGTLIVAMDGGTESYLEVDMSRNVSRGIRDTLPVIVGELEGIETDFVKFRQPQSSVDPVSINLARLQTLGEELVLTIVFRSSGEIPKASRLEWLQRIQNVTKECGGTINWRDQKWPFQTPEDRPVTKLCTSVMAQLGLGAEGLCSTVESNEASIFARSGIDALVFGPGTPMAEANSPGEVCSLEKAQTAIEFYSKVISEYCQ